MLECWMLECDLVIVLDWTIGKLKPFFFLEKCQFKILGIGACFDFVLFSFLIHLHVLTFLLRTF